MNNPQGVGGIATPDDIRDAIIHAYNDLVALGVFENAALFAQLLVVERNISDPNRIDVYLPVDHVNQLRIVAVNATDLPAVSVKRYQLTPNHISRTSIGGRVPPLSFSTINF